MFVQEIILIIFIVFGVFGNLANFYAFNHHTMRTHSTFRFLTYLSIFDLLCVLIGIPHVLIVINRSYDFRDHSDIACKLHSFLTNYTTHVSSNLLAAVSVDRVFSITRLKPAQVQLKKNKRINLAVKISEMKSSLNESSMTSTKTKLITNVEKAVLLIMLVVFLFDFHFLFWLQLNESDSNQTNGTTAIVSNSSANDVLKYCYPSKMNSPNYYHFFTSIWIWIDLGLYCYIPFLIMMTCTALIIHRLVKLNRAMKVHSKPIDSCNKDKKKMSKLNTEIAKRRARKNKQIYNLLLCLNLLFFVMVTPVVTLNSFGLLNDDSRNEVVVIIVYLLAYANHTFNFVFYGFSCKRYREIFIDLCLKYKYKCGCVNNAPSKQHRIVSL
jgi:hypothetical protein